MVKLCIGVLFLVAFLLSDVYSSSQYGRCVLYEDDEDTDSSKDHFCIEVDDKKYCLEWDCLPIACTNPIKRKKAKCAYCPGTCTFGGKVHYLYERFTCPDGINSCSCSYNNKILSSKIRVRSPEAMCIL